jgi:hypothetical protein
MDMHQALLYEALPEDYVRCNICQWRCRIAPKQTGVCRRYENSDGKLYNLNYGRASSIAADSVEKKPLYHFYPGSCASRWEAGLQFSLPRLPELDYRLRQPARNGHRPGDNQSSGIYQSG